MPAYVRMRRDLGAPIVPAPPPAGISLQQYGEQTARAAREMMRRVYPEGLGDNGISFEGFWDWLRADPDYDADLMFVAALGGDVVGLCHCWRSDFIKDLAVDPSFRNRGLGTFLLTHALTAFARRGAPSVDLKTELDNVKAQSLYRRLGFEIVERVNG